jgi:hypothetical protein
MHAGRSSKEINPAAFPTRSLITQQPDCAILFENGCNIRRASLFRKNLLPS